MKRFLITSPSWFGTVEITYKPDGLLYSIDLSNAVLLPGVIDPLKRVVPARVNDIETAFKNTRATVVQADFEATFDMFWKAYNKKINRKRAEELWDKLPKEQQVLAWAGVAAYDKYLKVNDWRSKADPETFLRNRYWENEYK
jgi:hypothetical protein